MKKKKSETNYFLHVLKLNKNKIFNLLRLSSVSFSRAAGGGRAEGDDGCRG